MEVQFRHSGESRNPAEEGGSRVEKQPAVYILASKRNGTLYIGVTSDLTKRVWEHKNDLVEGFTKRYSVHRLVWYEIHESMESAIKKERSMKGWKRVWKLELIESLNPDWKDMYHTIIQQELDFHQKPWIPAFAGMTENIATDSLGRFQRSTYANRDDRSWQNGRKHGAAADGQRP